MKQKTIAILVVIIGLAAAAGYFCVQKINQPDGSGLSADESKVRTTVEDFGGALKNVLLMTPDPGDLIRKNYVSYLTEDILERWVADPSVALGRTVSSPWPDRIDISSIQRVTFGEYKVFGMVIEIAGVQEVQSGIAARRSIELKVKKIGDRWLISGIILGERDETPDWKTFTQAGEFSIKLPQNYQLTSGPDLGGANLNQTIARIDFPEGTFRGQNTNFTEAFLVLSESNPAGSNCQTFSDLADAAEAEIRDAVINGVIFKQAETIGLAAGNQYDSKVYRAARGNRCYEIAVTVHTGNIGNYPEGTEEFGKQLAFRPLEKILGTFQFAD